MKGARFPDKSIRSPVPFGFPASFGQFRVSASFNLGKGEAPPTPKNTVIGRSRLNCRVDACFKVHFPRKRTLANEVYARFLPQPTYNRFFPTERCRETRQTTAQPHARHPYLDTEPRNHAGALLGIARRGGVHEDIAVASDAAHAKRVFSLGRVRAYCVLSPARVFALPLMGHLVVDGIRADFELPEQPIPLAFDAFTVPSHYFSAGNKKERSPAL